MLIAGDILVIRDSDRIIDPVDGDLQPFGGGKRLVGGDDPFPGFVGDGEQPFVADRHGLGLPPQTDGIQDLGKCDTAVAIHHKLQSIIGELDGIQGEAARDRRYRLGDLADVRLQFFSGQNASILFDVVNSGFKVFVRHFGEGKTHFDILSLRRLELLTGFPVNHLDIEGITRCDVLVLVAHLVHRRVHLALLVQ